ncbi:MAG: hypothetical protein RL272_630 [Candidatus Parcubacteria bacterium]
MHDHTPKPSTVAAAVIVPALLILIGAGCLSVADTLTNDAVLPAQVPIEALNRAKQVTEEQRAKENEMNEQVSDDMTVAMILTENAKVPAGAVLAGGTVGCNDRVAYVKAHRGASTDSVVHDALMTLFSVKDSNYQDLYDSLWQSNLTVDKILSTDGVTTEVWLKGKTQMGGVCDAPRFKAQIESTISRFKSKFKIYLNGSESAYRCLGDQSGQCK